jgi:hypothetical protein
MTLLAAVLIVGIPAPAPGVRGDEPGKARTSPEELYEALKGPWRADDEKSLLGGFWLHRHEKGPLPAPGASPWGVRLDFRRGGAETYRGAAAKVEADGYGLKISLPSAGQGETRTTRTLRVRRLGDKLEVRVTDGDAAGTYELRRAPSKQ